jgi:hypothetical protein
MTALVTSSTAVMGDVRVTGASHQLVLPAYVHGTVDSVGSEPDERALETEACTARRAFAIAARFPGSGRRARVNDGSPGASLPERSVVSGCACSALRHVPF